MRPSLGLNRSRFLEGARANFIAAGQKGQWVLEGRGEAGEQVGGGCHRLDRQLLKEGCAKVCHRESSPLLLAKSV